MEISQENTDYVPVRMRMDGTLSMSSEDNDVGNIEDQSQSAAAASPSTPPQHIMNICRTVSLGLLSALPTMLLIHFGANASIFSTVRYFIGLMSAAILIPNAHDKSGVMRWIFGVIFLGAASSYKSGVLLAKCPSMPRKAVLYAITALWECSNASLIIGGKDILEGYNVSRDHMSRDVALMALVPCQVNFVPQNHDDGSLRSRFQARDGHVYFVRCACILTSLMGVWFMNAVVAPFVADLSLSAQNSGAAFVLFLVDLECMAIAASMAVLLLNIPSLLWQIIHDLLAPTSLFTTLSSVMQHAPTAPNVILPYGWIYSSKSTRVFWSRWSRPAMQLIRRLFYYPLGGQNRWYLSIPVTFLTNASTHFDLSYAIVGDRAELYWIAIFGTLAIVSMLEVAGDKFLPEITSDGDITFPFWYKCIRAFMVHASLRLVLYIMVYKVFHTSFHDLFDRRNDV